MIKLKIILLKDIKKQGKIGDVLTVKDGYGSFLINKKDAVLATENSLDRLDRENKEKKLEEIELINECKKIKEKIEKVSIKFKVKVGAQDKVFGSISSKQIVEELKKYGYDLNKKQINLDTPIDTLGHHLVNIELHKKVVAKLNVELVK